MPTSLNLRRAKARSGIHAAAREYRKVVHIDSTLERETRKVVVRKYNKHGDVIETERTDYDPRERGREIWRGAYAYGENY